ncbi:MAG: hypothetical protein IPI72_12265 [Flavobacteriales bacterium]|nr:hypothetical protein [Flavobacteriales bacterium]
MQAQLYDGALPVATLHPVAGYGMYNEVRSSSNLNSEQLRISRPYVPDNTGLINLEFQIIDLALAPGMPEGNVSIAVKRSMNS